MNSIRRPKRIIIRGNDEKDYKFLVKCGEDLRQDQRIESLFGMMNDIFDRSATCRQMSLHIRTYQVIPMTSRYYIIGPATGCIVNNLVYEGPLEIAFILNLTYKVTAV